MGRKKVLYVIDSLGAGGAERQLVYTLQGLDRERFDPVVLTLYNQDTIPYHYGSAITALNIPIHSLNLPLSGGLKRLLRGAFQYTWLMWHLHPKVVQGCLHTANLITRLGRYLCPPHRLITVAQEQRYNATKLANERRTAFLVNGIVANSEHTKRILINQGNVPEHKIEIVHCGVEYQAFEANTNPDLRNEDFSNATFIAIIVGRIHRNKDHKTLLSAACLLKDKLPAGFRLVIIGHVFDEAVQAELENIIADCGLGQFVVQLPAINDVAPYYHAADVKILPSVAESFGLVVVEAAAAGTPVIVSEAANVLGLAEDKTTGWVFKTGDAQDLAHCIDEAIRMPEAELKALGENAKKRVPQYAVDKMVEGYMALYK